MAVVDGSQKAGEQLLFTTRVIIKSMVTCVDIFCRTVSDTIQSCLIRKRPEAFTCAHVLLCRIHKLLVVPLYVFASLCRRKNNN